MATGDQYQNGVRHSGTGEVYIKSDPTSTTTVAISTPAMAALSLTSQISPYGTARVSIEPGTMLTDPFDGATVDASKWTTGGTAVPTQANGTLSLSLAATNSISSTLISKSTFPPTLGFNLAGATVTFEAAKQTNPNAHRFYGFGQVTSYASATPVTDGCGFEVDLTGEFNAVVYVGGTRYVVNSTSNTLISSSAGTGGSGTAAPTGATISTFGQTMAWPTNSHRLIIAARGDLIYFYLDSLDVPVGVASFVQPNVLTLPLRIASITTPAVSTVLATTFTIGALGVGDSAAASQVLLPTAALWASPSNNSSTVYETSRIVKASAGNMYGISGYNSGPAQFIQLHDSATLPADTAVPVTLVPVAATSVFSIDFGVYGKKFLSGIVVTNSTTGPTKTIGAANCFFDPRFV